MNSEHKLPKSEQRYEVSLQAQNGTSINNVNGKRMSANCTIHLTGFSADTTCDMLAKYFSSFGKIIKVKIPRNDAGIFKNFGFIEFDSVVAQRTALSKTYYNMSGQTIKVRPFYAKNVAKNHAFRVNNNRMDKRVYVGMLPTWTTRNEIYNYFKRFGEVFSVYLPNVPIINYCFVTFMTNESARMALAHENHKLLDQEIVVKRALSNNELTAEQVIKKPDKLELIPGTYTTVAELIKNLESEERAMLDVLYYF